MAVKPAQKPLFLAAQDVSKTLLFMCFFESSGAQSHSRRGLRQRSSGYNGPRQPSAPYLLGISIAHQLK